MLWLISSIVIGLVIIALAVIFVWNLRKDKKYSPDYKSYFIMGIVWIIAGVPMMIFYDNFFFIIMGLIFTAIGITNKNKWNKTKGWKDLSDKEKGLRLMLMAVIAAGVIILILSLLLSCVSC